MGSKRTSATTAEQCLKSAVRQLRSLLKQAEAGEQVDMGTLKDLTAVMKELVKLRQALAQEREEKGMEIRVVMEKEVEAWSE